MTYKPSYYYFCVLLVLLSSCKTTSGYEQSSAMQAMESFAEERLGQPYDIVLNESESYALLKKELQTRPNDAYPSLRFLIYDLSNKKVIFETTEPGGMADWESDEVVRVSSQINIPNPDKEADNNILYRYNVKTMKKYKKGFMSLSN